MRSRFRDPTSIFGFVAGLIVLFALTVALALAVRPAEGHEPGDISIQGVASPDCREVDEDWTVEWTLTVDDDAAGPFAITDTNPTVKWSNGGDDVDPGESITTGVNYSASKASAQLVVTHDNNVHDAQSYVSNVVQRPALCPEPTPEPTATPEPEPTAAPTVTLTYCVGTSQVVSVNGAITSLTEGHPDCALPTPAPAPPTQAPIQPPNTGSGGLR